ARLCGDGREAPGSSSRTLKACVLQAASRYCPPPLARPFSTPAPGTCEVPPRLRLVVAVGSGTPIARRRSLPAGRGAERRGGEDRLGGVHLSAIHFERLERDERLPAAAASRQ